MKSAILLYDGYEMVHCQGDQDPIDGDASLVLCFGPRNLISAPETYQVLRQRFRTAEIVTCSTAGQIYGARVYDKTLSVVAIKFSSTRVVAHAVKLADYENSREAGKELIARFEAEPLNTLLVFSDGTSVNGSELSNALNSAAYPASGGLAGDGNRFISTVVGLNGDAQPGIIAGIGLAGNKLKVGYGSKGGWEPFGLERTVTSSQNNVLFEIDGKNPLELYKRYLGPEADNLPGSALLFPLAVKMPGSEEMVVRTILAIDDKTGTMTFAGDVPKGAKVRFMKANFDKISSAAADAATDSKIGAASPKLAILISCVGRKEILRSRADEEIEAVDEVFGGKTLLTGFYSYGELSPRAKDGKCQLHNQTMTITTLDEHE